MLNETLEDAFGHIIQAFGRPTMIKPDQRPRNLPQDFECSPRLIGFTMSDLATYVLQRTELPHEELLWMQSIRGWRTLLRGETFCDIGQSRHELGFLESGILQVYMVSSGGKKVVLDFVFAGSFALALDAALKGHPAEACFEAITPCRLSVWPYDETRHTALARHLGWERLQTAMLEEAFLRKNQRYLSLRVSNARRRYADMQQELPSAWRDIPQHLVASYLDITPQYLSRLRRAEKAPPILRQPRQFSTRSETR